MSCYLDNVVWPLGTGWAPIAKTELRDAVINRVCLLCSRTSKCKRNLCGRSIVVLSDKPPRPVRFVSGLYQRMCGEWEYEAVSIVSPIDYTHTRPFH